jgi:heme/copper-type cytochrome/quinol oxidase subunit 3
MANTAAETHAPTHHYTTTGLDNRKVAIWTFIGSECMLFASLISTYLIYKGKSIVGPFPHDAWTNPQTGQSFKAILDIPTTSISTFVLLMSSLAMVMALAAVENRKNPRPANPTFWWKVENSSKLWLFMTCLMGATFLVGVRFTSFVHEGLTVARTSGSRSSLTFGAHVTAGVIWLGTLLAIDMKRGLQPKDAVWVDIAALYWHFVDVVWIAIFTLVYLIQ